MNAFSHRWKPILLTNDCPETTRTTVQSIRFESVTGLLTKGGTNIRFEELRATSCLLQRHVWINVFNALGNQVKVLTKAIGRSVGRMALIGILLQRIRYPMYWRICKSGNMYVCWVRSFNDFMSLKKVLMALVIYLLHNMCELQCLRQALQSCQVPLFQTGSNIRFIQ